MPPVWEESTNPIRQIGSIPRRPTIDTVATGAVRCGYQYTPVLVKNTNGKLTCVESGNANGSYLFGEDNTITLADIDSRRPIVVSGGYSGCRFRVFQTGKGQFTCMHIYNPGTASRLPHVADRYVGISNGKEIATLGSLGLAGPSGCDGVWFTCQLVSANTVRISRLEVGKTGNVLGQVVGMFPGHSFR